jgi:hypothetical protein
MFAILLFLLQCVAVLEGGRFIELYFLCAVKCEHSEKQLSIGGMAVVISCPNCSLATSVVANHLLVSRVDIPCFLVIFLLHQLFGHLSKYPFCSVQELSYPMTSVWIEISQVYPSKGFM